eukprot:scaffold14064_cov177-Amphora_coffeaeformis.AAC.2
MDSIFSDNVLFSQRSLLATFVGLFCTLNFVSLFSLAQKVPNLLSETDEGRAASHPYDWRFGIIQYCVGLPIAFMGLVSLEGSALSVLSKLSPPRFRGVAVNTGTYVVFVGFIARLIGDFQLYFVVLSHRLINTDIVNAVIMNDENKTTTTNTGRSKIGSEIGWTTKNNSKCDRAFV